MFGTILAVILTLLVVGGATGAAMYRVLDRSNTTSTSEDGAVVEPIFESASPAPTDEATDAPVSEPQTAAPRQQRTQEPTTTFFVPRRTQEPHDTPHETAEQDEDRHTDPPTEAPTDDFSESPG